jgi:molecular chaperone DnaK
LKDTGDKLGDADKRAIEEAMDAVKKANEGTDAGAIQKALDQLTAAQHKAAESLYKQGGAAGAPGGAAGGPGDAGGGAGAGASAESSAPKGDVIDAEVVDEGKQ